MRTDTKHESFVFSLGLFASSVLEEGDFGRECFRTLLKNQSVYGTSKCFTFGIGVGNFHRFWNMTFRRLEWTMIFSLIGLLWLYRRGSYISFSLQWIFLLKERKKKKKKKRKKEKRSRPCTRERNFLYCVWTGSEVKRSIAALLKNTGKDSTKSNSGDYYFLSNVSSFTYLSCTIKEK